MSRTRKIIHIDMDAFFAAIEQKDNPQLHGRPVIVGGRPDSRGVVAACSYEARAFGIHSAMPSAKAARLCPFAVFVFPRMTRYVEISRQIMTIFKKYTPLVEPLSLDEAFLDVTDTAWQPPSATLLAKQICEEIYENLGLTASAGVSYNKFLAKVASDVNKPHGITTIPPTEAQKFIDALPIRKFFGVGKVTEKKMLQLGITCGADLRKWELPHLMKCFGKTGSFLYSIARGIDERPVEWSRIRKSIGSETTLSNDTSDIKEVETILKELSKEVVETITKKQISAHTLTLKIRYKDFTTVTRSVTRKKAITGLEDLLSLLPDLLAKTEAGTKMVRLVGISLSKLTGHSLQPRQLCLPFE